MVDPTDTPVSDGNDASTPSDGAVIERRVKVAMVPVTELQAERRKRQEAEARAAELAAYETDAKAWRDWQAAEAAKLADQNAADLAGLPDDARAALSSITDPKALRAALDVVKRVQPAPAAPPPAAEATALEYPAGASASRGAAVDTLTAEERAWKASQPTLSGAADATVKRLYQLSKPKGR